MVISNKRFNKIFCVGYNKTGTTTIETVLRFYGYSLPNQRQQEIRLTQNVFATDYKEFISFVSQFDAFQDMPFSQGSTYVAADALFPNSKFILTERDSQEWFYSMVKFHEKIFEIDDMSKITEQDVKAKFNYLFPGYLYKNKQRFLSAFVGDKKEVMWDNLYDEEYYISQYERRNMEIKKYFSESNNKLLTIDATKEKDTEKLCEFLNIPTDFKIAMPHANKT